MKKSTSSAFNSKWLGITDPSKYKFNWTIGCRSFNDELQELTNWKKKTKDRSNYGFLKGFKEIWPDLDGNPEIAKYLINLI